MPTRIDPLETSTLAEALPGAPFAEHHHRIVDAPVDACWDALHAVRWRDLTITVPLFAIRSGGRMRGTALDLDRRLVDPPSPGFPVHEVVPRYSTSAMVGRPWAGALRGPQVSSLADLAAFDDPGWLRYGMDWRLTALDGERTLVETSTLSDPTDAAARRAFARYWRIIRPFSGLIRRDILRAVARRAEAAG